MADGVQRVGVDEVQWSGVISWVRIFKSFRMAIQPSRLLLALLFVILCFLGGKVLDFMWGPSVYNGEITQYISSTPENFEAWRTSSKDQLTTSLQRYVRGKGFTSEETEGATSGKDRFARTQTLINKYYDNEQQRLIKSGKEIAADIATQKKQLIEEVAANRRTQEYATERSKRLEENLAYTQKAQADQSERLELRRREELQMVRQLQPKGVFEASSQFVLGAFDRGVLGAASLNFGLGDALRADASSRNSASVAGALRDVFITLPGWLYRTHFWYMLVYSLLGMLLWSVIGGAIYRMAALDATLGKQSNTAAAVEFASRRLIWFFLTPLFPFVACALLGLVLMLAGLVFFNAKEVWLLDIAGGALFGVAIIIGLIIAIILILTAGGIHLFYPALAVEGTDAFDALSRSFGYLIARPWRWLFYTMVSMVYFALSYLFVGMVLFLGLSITQSVIRLAVFRETSQGSINRFDAMLPAPSLGHLVYEVEWSILDTPGKIAAALIWVWVFVTVSVLAAFAISFYASVHTWIYLLLRKSVDGTGYDEVFIAQPAVISLAGQSSDQQTSDDGPKPADKVEPSADAQSKEPSEEA